MSDMFFDASETKIEVHEPKAKPEYELKSKYFSFLSGLTVKELHDIARESKIYGHAPLRKADLIRFLDGRCVTRRYNYQKRIKKCLRRWMFPDTLRAWVELFVSDKSIAEHYVQIILCTLSPTNCFRKKKEIDKRE